MFDSIKKWATNSLVKKYAGSVVRSGMLVVSGYLVGNKLADPAVAAAFTGSLGTIILNTLDLVLQNPDLWASVGLGSGAQIWSLWQKKAGALQVKSKKGK
jgi:hypothetical protein